MEIPTTKLLDSCFSGYQPEGTGIHRRSFPCLSGWLLRALDLRGQRNSSDGRNLFMNPSPSTIPSSIINSPIRSREWPHPTRGRVLTVPLKFLPDSLFFSIRSGDLQELLENDQLNKARSNELAFKGFVEAPITFLPTYKFDVGKSLHLPSSLVPSSFASHFVLVLIMFIQEQTPMILLKKKEFPPGVIEFYQQKQKVLILKFYNMKPFMNYAQVIINQ